MPDKLAPALRVANRPGQGKKISMLEIAIPSRSVLRLEYLVLDVNGTIALDGQLIARVGERLEKLTELLTTRPCCAARRWASPCWAEKGWRLTA
jgi:hypothetical protein